MCALLDEIKFAKISGIRGISPTKTTSTRPLDPRASIYGEEDTNFDPDSSIRNFPIPLMASAPGTGRGGSQGGRGGTDVHSSRRGTRLSDWSAIAEETDDSVNPNTNQDGQDADGFTVHTNAKAARRAAQAALWKVKEAERRSQYPFLYQAGYDDAQVRGILAGPTFKTPGLPLSSRGRGGQGQSGGQPGRGGSQHTHARGGSQGRGGFPTNAGRPAGVGRGSLPRQGSSTPATPGSKRRFDQSNSGITPPAKKPSPTPDQARGGSNYAQAAARENFPHMLTVFKGALDKCPLSDELFRQVAIKLRKRVLAYSQEEGHIMLRTAFIRWYRNAGKIACQNKATSDWYREEVSKLDLEGTSFRAWDAREMDLLHVARMNISGLDDMEPEEIITLVRGFTPELDGLMKVTKTEGEGRGLILVLGIDDKMAHSLASLEQPWKVNLGTDQRKIQFSGKQALRDKDLALHMEDVSVSGSEKSSEAST